MSLFDSKPAEFIGTALGWAAGPLFALTSALRRARTFHLGRGVRRGGRRARRRGGRRAAPRPRARALLQRPVEGPSGAPGRARLRGALSPRRGRLDRGGRRRPGPPLRDDPAALHHPLRAAHHGRARLPRQRLLRGVPLPDVPGLGLAYLRLRPAARPAASTAPRAERLRKAVARGEASLVLEARRAWRWRWAPIARVSLREPVAVDQEALRFSPFRAGRGVVRRGLVHGLRRGVYALSQWARPARGTARAESDGP